MLILEKCDISHIISDYLLHARKWDPQQMKWLDKCFLQLIKLGDRISQMKRMQLTRYFSMIKKKKKMPIKYKVNFPKGFVSQLPKTTRFFFPETKSNKYHGLIHRNKRYTGPHWKGATTPLADPKHNIHVHQILYTELQWALYCRLPVTSIVPF